MAALTSESRLAAVHASGVWDLPVAERLPFERLARLAAGSLGVPRAAVAVLDAERLHMIAAYDMDAVELPASEFVCSRVVASGARVAVADIRLDPDFAEFSALHDVVAYAGVPLHGPTGEVLGTLCAIDAQPRAWTSRELDLLDDLSAIGTAELVLRATAAGARRTRDRMGAVVSSALDAIVTMDGAGRVTEFNPAAERMFGYSRNRALGSRLAELIVPPGHRPAHHAGYLRNVATGVSHILDRRLELPAMRSDGSEFPAELTVTRTDTDAGPSYVGFLRDVSVQRAAERALEDAEAALALTVEHAPVALFALDAGGQVTVADGSALQAFGVVSADLVGRSVFDLYANRPDVLADVERALGGATVAVTHRFGDLVFELRSGPLPEAGGIAGIAIDVSERFRDQARIAELAYVDRLTRLPNRVWFEEDVDRTLCGAGRPAGRTAALLFVDLDDFQRVNDSLGHAAGDEVLREAASRLLAVAGPQMRLARQGADEFLFFVDDLGPDPSGAAERVALEIITALEAPFATTELEFHVEASVGISTFPRDGEDFAALLRGAESALVRAKRSAGTRMAVHRRDDAAARRRLTMSARLRRALAEDQFVLDYQPIFRLADGQPAGVEALLRWDDPELGRLPPGDFIPVAEATGLIVPIGAWVAETACRQSLAWLALGLDVTVGFNVSPVQLQRDDFAAELWQILERTGTPSRSMVVEITESVAMDGGEGTRRLLERLAGLRVGIVVDDFGAGHSSLTRLRRLDASAVKIDRALLEGVPHDTGAAAVVSASLALAEALGIPTVAEGVETEAQRRFLRDGGCRWAQGFGLARPMDAAAVTDLLLTTGVPAAGSLTGG